MTLRTKEIRIRVKPETQERFYRLVSLVRAYYGVRHNTPLEDVLNIIIDLAENKLFEDKKTFMVD